MKKIISTILIICLILEIFPCRVIAATADITSGTTGECAWTLNGTVLTISGNGKMGNYTYSSSSPWGTDITKLIIEEGVTTVGNYAFYTCRSLESVTLPDGIVSIGNSSFNNCTSLKSITIPSSLKSFGNRAFCYCRSLPGIVIPEGVTSIGDDAFYFCSIKDITIPSSLKTIGNDAFTGCKLENIVIPSNVSSIGKGAFGYCNSLTNITVDSNNLVYYSSNNCIIEKSTNRLVVGCKTSIIPNNVKTIGNHAFTGVDIVDIKIPDGVTKFEEYAFAGSDITKITIPKSVKNIQYGAFSICSLLADVNYSGTKIDKKNINISERNSLLVDAKWHYASCENEAHVYKYACSTICENCEHARTGNVSHVYDNDCDIDCNLCGETRTVKHLYKKSSNNTAICSICNMSKTFDFIITTDETITLSYKASKRFEFVVDNTKIAKTGEVLNSVVSWGSSYNQASSVQILPVFPGETSVNAIDTLGKTLTSSSLLVVEGNHKMGLIFSEKSKAATCIEEGIAVYKCSFCGFEEERKIDKISHTYGKWKKYDETNHQKTCDCGDTIYENHSFDGGIVTKNPTTSEFGEKTYTCKVCGEEKKEPMDKLVTGDLNADDLITDADAVYLLMYTFFPEDYAVKQTLDFNNDGSITDADAVYLLMFTFFPEDYPMG